MLKSLTSFCFLNCAIFQTFSIGAGQGFSSGTGYIFSFIFTLTSSPRFFFSFDATGSWVSISFSHFILLPTLAAKSSGKVLETRYCGAPWTCIILTDRKLFRTSDLLCIIIEKISEKWVWWTLPWFTIKTIFCDSELCAELLSDIGWEQSKRSSRYRSLTKY